MPHDAPFRLRVMRAITDSLKTITPANGYVTDLSDFTDQDDQPASRVFRGRDIFGESDPLPLVSVLESPDAAELVNGAPGFEEMNWLLLVQGFTVDDKENPTDPAYVLSADVRRHLEAEKLRKHPTARNQRDPFGMGVASGQADRILDLAIGAPVVRPPDLGVSSRAYFWTVLGLKIVEHPIDPYA